MIALDELTDEQFERHALDLLPRELGLDGLARFLRFNRSGKGDYTRDRGQWQKDLTLDEILESLRKLRPLAASLSAHFFSWRYFTVLLRPPMP